jgi:hypothetical protein
MRDKRNGTQKMMNNASGKNDEEKPGIWNTEHRNI